MKIQEFVLHERPSADALGLAVGARLLAKAHVRGYTRKDGVAVRPHSKRVKPGAKKVTVAFSNAAYERSHGSAPRGRGAWMFGINDPDPDTSLKNEGKTHITSPSMTFGEAKKWATTKVAELDLKTSRATLHVLP